MQFFPYCMPRLPKLPGWMVGGMLVLGCENIHSIFWVSVGNAKGSENCA